MKKLRNKRALFVITMYLLILVSFYNCVGAAMANEFNVNDYLKRTYLTVGAGYKFNEPYNTIYKGANKDRMSPISARIEIGYQYSKHLRFGVSHHSQWLDGIPFNDTKEYSKTEVFVDYTIYFGD